LVLIAVAVVSVIVTSEMASSARTIMEETYDIKNEVVLNFTADEGRQLEITVRSTLPIDVYLMTPREFNEMVNNDWEPDNFTAARMNSKSTVMELSEEGGQRCVMIRPSGSTEGTEDPEVSVKVVEETTLDHYRSTVLPLLLISVPIFAVILVLIIVRAVRNKN